MKEVDPNETKRARSYICHINAPMPMVTIFKTIRVTNILNLSKGGYKFNMLMSYCIGLAAEAIEEFYMLPVCKKLIQYDSLGVNVIVRNKKGAINSCNIPFNKNIEEFNRSYLELTNHVIEDCKNYKIDDAMVINTSSLAKHSFDGVVNMYNDNYTNPFLAWGKYEDQGDDKIIKLSFQFHHVQMDGEEACQFLDNLQQEIDNIAL